MVRLHRRAAPGCVRMLRSAVAAIDPGDPGDPVASVDPRIEGPWPRAEAREGAGAWARLRDFAQSPRGRRIRRVARGAVMAAVAGHLLWQLRAIGWREIGANLPTHPGFYLLFAVIYLQVSLGEMIAYRLCWSFDVRRSIPAFLKKRIYNRELLGYSGEVYFFGWARREVKAPLRRLAETIRDQNIVSSIASTAVAVGLCTFYLTNGRLPISRIGERLAAASGVYGLGLGLGLAIAAALAYRYRRYLFSMSLKVAGLVLALHVVRLLLGQAVQIWQWELGAPAGTVEVWFTLSAASIIANRIPLLPSRDLLFVSAGVALSESLQLGTAAVSGMLLVNAMLAKVVSFGLYAGLSMVDKGRPREAAAASEALAAARLSAADDSRAACRPR